MDGLIIGLKNITKIERVEQVNEMSRYGIYWFSGGLNDKKTSET